MNLPWRPAVPPIDRSGPPIYSSLTERESRWLVENTQGRALEVGSAFGYSTVCIAEHARNLIAVDPHVTHASFDECLRNLQIYGLDHKVALLQGPSRMVLPMFGNGYFDFAFIDGDHTFDEVTFDADEAFRLVKPGGLIAFHDYGEDSCPEVATAIDAWHGRRFLSKQLVQVDTLVAFQW